MSLHLFLAHFPVALFVMGFAFDLFGAATGNREARRWAGVLVILGALSSFGAFFTGGGATGELLGRGYRDFARLEEHSQWGGAGVWPLMIVGGLRAAWWGRLEGGYGWANLALAALAALLVTAISLSGTAIMHGVPVR